jgi:hypothetical protein
MSDFGDVSSEMKSNQKRFAIVLAIVGLGAVLCCGWWIYRSQVAADEKRNSFSAPATSSAPDAFHNAPPPPQP